MKILKLFLFTFILLIYFSMFILAQGNQSSQLSEKDINLTISDDNEPVVNIDMHNISNSKDIKIFTLEKPFRIVLDFYNTEFIGNAPIKKVITDSNITLINQLRIAQYQKNITRLVIDLKQKCRYKKNLSSNQLSLILKNNIKIKHPDKNIIFSNPLEKRINLNFKDADVQNVLRILSEVSGLNIIAGEKVKGKVTVSFNDITVKDALKSILKVNGYDYIRDHNIIKVMPFEMFQKSPEPYSTKIIKLKNAIAEDIIASLNKLISPYGSVEILKSSNAIIVTDTLEYISRIRKIVKKLDSKKLWGTDKFQKKKASETDIIKVFPLKYSSANNLKPVIEKILKSKRGLVECDERTNSLIITGKKDYVDKAASIIRNIDKTTTEGFDKTFTKVYLIKYAESKDIVKIADNIFEERKKKQSLDNINKKYTKLVADERINGVIINTNEESNINILEDIINKIDLPIKQVLIEARFIEVGLNKSNSLGVNWANLGNLEIESTEKPLTWDLKNWNPTYGELSVSQLQAVLKMLNTDGNVNLLSAPKIATLDNKKAIIKVTDDIVIGEKTFESEAGKAHTSQVRSEVGIVLEVVPHINNQDLITLDIKPSVNDAKLSAYKSGEIDITKREAQTSIVIKDNSTIVIGGLIKNNLKETNSGVPILKKIPILKLLFSHKSTEIQKTELLIFITPKIINPKDSLDSENKDNWNRSEEKIGNLKRDLLHRY